MDLDLWWKSLHNRYLGHTAKVFPANTNDDAFYVRDAFLLSLNLPVLGEQIAFTIEKVNSMDVSI